MEEREKEREAKERKKGSGLSKPSQVTLLTVCREEGERKEGRRYRGFSRQLLLCVFFVTQSR